MKFGKIALAASAVSFAIAPVAVAAERASAPAIGESEIGGGNGAVVGVVFALLALAVFIAVGGSDDPVSP